MNNKLTQCTGWQQSQHKGLIEVSEVPVTPVEPVTPLCSPVLDLEAALRRMGGTLDVYGTVAADFRTALAGLPQALQACAAAQDMPTMRSLLHTFKGNSGTVGLMPLSLELGRLEAMCSRDAGTQQVWQAASQLPALIHEADMALELACAQVALRLAQQQLARDPAIEQAMVAADFERMLHMLRAHDLSALEVFASLQGQLAGLAQDIVKPLSKAMKLLDFDTAARYCSELLKQGSSHGS